MATSQFKRLVRFVPKNDSSTVLIGQPADDNVDVGAAVRKGQDVSVKLFSGSSVLSAGQETGKTAVIDRILSPLTMSEVGTIRCIGLNYKQHASEVGMALPKVPTVFLKPDTALADPWPAPTPLPKITQEDNCGDYESELCVVIGKPCRDVSESDALDYVLGYTASNDISSRTYQLNQSQWCFSKGFDKSCPIGPTLVSTSVIPDPSKLRVRGLLNDEVVQDCGTDDLIFSIAKIVSFLSIGTTLRPGTIIITGTPAGVGMGQKPQKFFKNGDEFAVEILPHIGTLHNVMKYE